MKNKIEKSDIDMWSGQNNINVKLEEEINRIIDHLNSQAQPKEKDDKDLDELTPLLDMALGQDTPEEMLNSKEAIINLVKKCWRGNKIV